ncbi:MAG: M28 family peptidase [Lentisphaerae bacterium]|nr:M28 family peptidase [Lentisphaerota bacterium]
MFKRKTTCLYPLLLILALLFAPFGCARKPAADAVSWDPARLQGTNALVETRRFVELGPKIAGTPGAETAAASLYARLQALGLKASLDVFTEPAPGGPTVFRNITAELQGRGSRSDHSRSDRGLTSNWVVLCAHYDTKSGIGESFAGANDSGSGTGLLLELGRALRDGRPHNVNVLLAFLDGEECKKTYGAMDGLHGSRRLARQLHQDGRSGNVRGVILLDMIGDRDLTITLPRNGSIALVSQVLTAAGEEGARLNFTLSTMTITDDHQPFLDAGMPAVDLIDFEYGSAPGKNDYWHTAADTMDKLSADSLQTVGRVVIRTLNRLASTP